MSEAVKDGLARDRRTPAQLRRRQLQTLAGYVCPHCRGDLALRRDGSGVNECRRCGFELITEWEYERRQREGSK